MVTLARSIVIAGALVATAAVADPIVAPSCPAPPAAAARGLAAIDWCNFDVGTWKGSLVDGHNEVHLYADLGKPHDTIATSLRGVAYHDLDGDRRAEAWLVIEQTSWFAASDRSSTGTDVQVYTRRKGRPVRVATIATGTPVHDLAVARGVVTIVSGPDHAVQRLRWRPTRGAFVELAPPTP